jgi:hypothetical protein
MGGPGVWASSETIAHQARPGRALQPGSESNTAAAFGRSHWHDYQRLRLLLLRFRCPCDLYAFKLLRLAASFMPS